MEVLWLSRLDETVVKNEKDEITKKVISLYHPARAHSEMALEDRAKVLAGAKLSQLILIELVQGGNWQVKTFSDPQVMAEELAAVLAKSP